MSGPHQTAILVHGALQRAGYSMAAGPNSPGYIVAEVKTLFGRSSALEVSHIPLGDDPDAHARAYYRTLACDKTLAGLAIQFDAQPYPKVHVRG
jgi:hypothetical protein